MWKRFALLGSIAALTITSASSAGAQVWGPGPWGGWGPGGVTVTVSTFPAPFFPRRRPCCFRPLPPRPVFCCYRRWYAHPYYRPPYWYGDNFVPFAYGAAYNETGFDGDFDGE